MKIYIANTLQKNRVGGGFTFIDNFKKALGDKCTDNYDEASIYLIAGATMVSRDDVKKAKADGKKVVFRIDNVLRNSRNRGTGMPRIYDFAEMSDAVVYQSSWAQDFLGKFTGKVGTIILNSADESVFNPEGSVRPKQGEPQYLYSRSSRDEGKNWISTWYRFQQEYFRNPKAHLWIHGQFGPENEPWRFDFFGGAEERYSFRGFVQSPKEMAEIYRSCDYLIYPFIFDACSNTLVEAIVSGCKVKYLGEITGGAIDIKEKFEWCGREYFYLKRMADEYLTLFESL